MTFFLDRKYQDINSVCVPAICRLNKSGFVSCIWQINWREMNYFFSMKCSTSLFPLSLFLNLSGDNVLAPLDGHFSWMKYEAF